ncbi:MAG: hypothetical protein ACM3N5_12705, partial [Candidatus Eiseniibacteriota bacterium]
MSASPAVALKQAPRHELESAVIRFAGDSGDGMQLTGSQFTTATALAGNDLATFPDFPAEIRAPVGTTYGVSAYQINFGSRRRPTRPTCGRHRPAGRAGPPCSSALRCRARLAFRVT